MLHIARDLAQIFSMKKMDELPKKHPKILKDLQVLTMIFY